MSPLPIWAGGLGALALCFLVLPLAFMLGRVNWSTLGATLATAEARDALGLSMRTCAIALGVDLLLGVPAALVLSRSWRGVRAARILVALPLSLPPVVAGIALLAAFGRRSTLGALLSGAGLDIAFTTSAVVIAQVFVSLPFLIVTLESALRSRERGLDEMASSLGPRPRASSGRSPCLRSCPASVAAPPSRSPAASANSARPSPSPGPCRA